jgi:hypothetical protein
MQTAHRWPQAKTTRFVTMARAWPGISRCTPWTISNTRTCIGQDHAAKELVDDVDAFREATPATPAAAYAMAAIPARYAVERRDWGPGGEPFTSVGDNVLVQLSLDKGDDLLCSSAWRGSDGRCRWCTNGD